MTRPRLHPEDLDHESRVLGAVDALLLGNHNYKRMTAKILEAQDRLQALCNEDAWVAFLDIEAAFSTRVNFMLVTVAKWAFHERGRHQRQPRGGR